MEESDFSKVAWMGTEVRTDPSYYWHNRRRNDSMKWLVVQRTLKGAGFFEDADGRRLVPRGHVMLFTFDEDSTYGYPEEATEPYELVFLLILPSRCVRLFFDAVRNEFGSVVRMRERGGAGTLLDEIVERKKEGALGDDREASALLVRLFDAIYREQAVGSAEKDPIAKGHDIIQSKYASPISLKGLASKCGVSREHFIRGFRKRFGTSPAVMVRNLRLQHARQALGFSRMSVEQISRDCGFTNTNSFCRAFRREFGRSPLEERAGERRLVTPRGRRRS